MPRNKYRPNYLKLYPDVHISIEVMEALKTSDRKMEYQEYDVKRQIWKIDVDAQKAKCIPSREDSYERLLDEDKQFRNDIESVEDTVIKSIILEKLNSCLARLDKDEQALIRALFYDSMSEREYAEELGLSKTALHKRKVKILGKIKKYFNI